jgi:outer membrane receptor for ferrienterochelin and colicins
MTAVRGSTIAGVALLAFCLPALSAAQTPTAPGTNRHAAAAGDRELGPQPDDPQAGEIVGMGLEELLFVEISVACAEPRTVRDAPAVVTVVTREEIQESGARDLIDALRLVSGFDFGMDVWGVIGVGFRGDWGQEAKIMLAVDGLVLNELMYGNLAFGNHIPVDAIERIEIIRGPGSVIHGNFAELGVINVVTTIGAERPGLSGSLVTGTFEDGYARANLGASYGIMMGSESYLGISVFGATAQPSTRTYTDIFGDSFDMEGNHDARTLDLGLHYRRGPMHAQFYYDGFRTTFRDGYDAILPASIGADFTSYLGDVSWTLTPRPDVAITPALKVKVQQPWRSTDVPSDDFAYYDPTAQQYGASLKVNWATSSTFSLLAGGEFDREGARYGDEMPYFFPNDEKSVHFQRYALFAEGYLKTAPAQVTLGLRVEGHSDYNSAVTPRVGITRTFGDTHVKLIYNRSFRAPSIEQISFGQDVQTEEADVYEMEIGHRFGDTAYLGANLFDIHMHRPIFYFYDTVNEIDTFRNLHDLGSRGIELEGRLHGRAGRLTARYSFYAATDKDAGYYTAPGDEDLFLAFPAHKFTMSATLPLASALSLNPSLIWTSARYAYDHYDSEAEIPLASKLSPEAVTHVYLLYKGLFGSPVDVGLGVYDLFAAQHDFVQPYNGQHAPLPGPGREFLLKVGLGLD